MIRRFIDFDSEVRKKWLKKFDKKVKMWYHIDNSRRKERKDLVGIHVVENISGCPTGDSENMAKSKDLAKIHVAAIYFAEKSRDINKIATTVGVSTRTIRRWSTEEPEWEKALQLWENGPDTPIHVNRAFETKPKRNARRDTSELFEAAETAYREAIERDVASHKLASQTAEKVGKGLTRRRVFEWAKLYGWGEGDETKILEGHPPDKEQ